MKFKEYQEAVEKERVLEERYRAAREERDKSGVVKHQIQLSDKMKLTVLSPYTWGNNDKDPFVFMLDNTHLNIKEAKALQLWLNNFFEGS